MRMLLRMHIKHKKGKTFCAAEDWLNSMFRRGKTGEDSIFQNSECLKMLSQLRDRKCLPGNDITSPARDICFPSHYRAEIAHMPGGL